jgi:hypothetical protein
MEGGGYPDRRTREQIAPAGRGADVSSFEVQWIEGMVFDHAGSGAFGLCSKEMIVQGLGISLEYTRCGGNPALSDD